IGAIAGITSVLIVLLFGQSRIMMRMSRDGLMSPIFGKINPKYNTPTWAIVICGTVVAAFAGLLPISELAELSNIGTLAAFVLVCVGVLVLRKSEPDRERKFRAPDYARAPLPIALLFVVAIALVHVFFPGFLSLSALVVFGITITWFAILASMAVL